MVTEIKEPIKVGVVFTSRKIKPVWFVWNNFRYDITHVTFSWRSREGSAPLYHFSVTDGSNLFEICFNTKTAEWMLDRIECEGGRGGNCVAEEQKCRAVGR